MNYDVFLASFFKENISNLKKKYQHVNQDIKFALRVICKNPQVGKSLHRFGKIKKFRVRNSDIGKGKRSGYRLIYYLDSPNRLIYPLLMYSKSYKKDVTESEVKNLLKKLSREIVKKRGHC